MEISLKTSRDVGEAALPEIRERGVEESGGVYKREDCVLAAKLKET